jgi:protein gp37
VTGISWTDETWNPVRGCSRVSEGCRHCYAEVQAARIVRMGQGKPTPYDGLVRVTAGGEARWTGEVRLDPKALALPLRWKKPRRIFVNSMSDLFHESLTNEQIAAVFGVMAAAPQHTFQCLTKRPARMREFLTHPEVRHWIAKAKDAALVERDHKPEETWRDIPGFSGYQASSHGRIRNAESKTIQQYLNEHEQIGRYTVTIYKYGHPTTQFVHRLVLLAFNGKPCEDEEACHRNGNKLDNRAANLRWGTRSENQQEKVRHGSRGGPAKLTPEQVADIRARRAAGETQQTIADAFNVSRSLVSMIESGSVWAEPDLPWPLPNVWLGVSVEAQAAADERIPELLRTPAAVRFLSCEPLLGKVDLRLFDGGPLTPRHRLLHWCIAGCESGPGARPCSVEWLRSLRDQCAAAGVSFWLKQATDHERGMFSGASLVTCGPGSRRKHHGVIELPYLDGQQHAAFPEVRRG